MKRIENLEDDMRGQVRYEFAGGRTVMLDANAVREYGAAELIRRMGYGDLVPAERLPVYEPGSTRFTHGPLVGTLPADFDPMFIKSRSPMYDPRSGDFKRDGNAWIVSPTLGAGDLACIPGFVRASA